MIEAKIEATPHVSDLRWDRLLAGELAAADRAEALGHADACPACTARRAEITAGLEAFVRAPPPMVRRSPRRTAVAALGVMGVMAAVVLVLRARPVDDASGLRTKGGGGPTLMLTARSHGRLQPVAAGDRVQPGDYLQAIYTTARDGFGAVLARDGKGAAAAYVPAEGDVMVALPAGTRRSFPASTILDDVVGAQAVIVVWCEAAWPLAPLLAELRASGDVTAPRGCAVQRVVLDVRGAR